RTWRSTCSNGRSRAPRPAAGRRRAGADHRRCEMANSRPITHAAALAGYLLGAVALSRGTPVDAMAAFLLPTTIVAIDVLLRMLSKAPGDEPAAEERLAVVDAMVARIAVFVV